MQSYERADPYVQMQLTLERNLNLIEVSRDGYTLLDWFSDIGGIQGILISLIGLFLGVWNYNNLDNFLASQLYQIRRKQDRKEITISVFGGLKDYFCDMMPSCMQCCRNGRNERALILGREKLEREANII